MDTCIVEEDAAVMADKDPDESHDAAYGPRMSRGLRILAMQMSKKLLFPPRFVAPLDQTTSDAASLQRPLITSPTFSTVSKYGWVRTSAQKTTPPSTIMPF